MFSKDTLIQSIEIQKKITQAFIADNKFGFNLPLDEFLLHCFPLNPQRYGLRVQFYIAHMMKYTALSSKLDCGDFLNREGEEVEIKCSFLSESNETIAIKQIRPWQKLKYYYIFVVFFHDLYNLQYKCFKLSRKEMEEEMILCNAKPVHSTKERNEGNINVEYGFSVKTNSATYTKWQDTYELKKFDLKKICEERIKEENYTKELEEKLNSKSYAKYFETVIEEPKFDHKEENISDSITIEPKYITINEWPHETPYPEQERKYLTIDKYSNLQAGEEIKIENETPTELFFMVDIPYLVEEKEPRVPVSIQKDVKSLFARAKAQYINK